ncbi:zinc-binding alcohol dehydrogenase family protein [Corticibacter populi]|uniref:Zinc-type alcohol dehydrogenase-like protein n=1 Tax=Corticibacter populi TaxID=1550736 RepID=A0A3M6QQ92_9BURK|nr:zinc-binding alcohol dehydrogenase family protein [Corticibacter populi]RMX04971.1 zinc-binding alcohol dehydrogenase family protein [Corticibacter populi]RZS33601.1 zinc-binding alcohol dehydrogenase family protein [Corticibacter populi]
MKAIGFQQPLPITHPDALQDLELPEPVAAGRDLLVEVQAVSVNPVDVKVRASAQPADGMARVLGWDAAGIVRAVGEQVQGFAVGDRVWYAGALNRPGSNAQLQLVDASIAAPAPRSLDFARAAALPLTLLTAWELLFERLQVQTADLTQAPSLLVVGAAGGVGSILLQLARQLTGLTVVGTASRPATREWALQQGAHHVIDHHRPWAAQLQALGLADVTHVAGLTHTADHLAQIVEVLRPEGHLALIDDPEQLDIRALKPKSLSVHWELMFTPTLFQTRTMARQHAILRRGAELVDAGVLKSTLTERIEGISAANLRRAHAQIESGTSCGKIVLAGWPA